MKNKDKYNLSELRFVRKQTHRDKEYEIIFCTHVYLGKTRVAIIPGGSFSGRMAWLEEEEKC